MCGLSLILISKKWRVCNEFQVFFYLTSLYMIYLFKVILPDVWGGGVVKHGYHGHWIREEVNTQDDALLVVSGRFLSFP